MPKYETLLFHIQENMAVGFPGDSPGDVLCQLGRIWRIKLDIEGKIPGASCNDKGELEKNKHTRTAL